FKIIADEVTQGFYAYFWDCKGVVDSVGRYMGLDISTGEESPVPQIFSIGNKSLRECSLTKDIDKLKARGKYFLNPSEDVVPVITGRNGRVYMGVFWDKKEEGAVLFDGLDWNPLSKNLSGQERILAENIEDFLLRYEGKESFEKGHGRLVSKVLLGPENLESTYKMYPLSSIVTKCKVLHNQREEIGMKANWVAVDLIGSKPLIFERQFEGTKYEINFLEALFRVALPDTITFKSLEDIQISSLRDGVWRDLGDKYNVKYVEMSDNIEKEAGKILKEQGGGLTEINKIYNFARAHSGRINTSTSGYISRIENRQVRSIFESSGFKKYHIHMRGEEIEGFDFSNGIRANIRIETGTKDILLFGVVIEVVERVRELEPSVNGGWTEVNSVEKKKRIELMGGDPEIIRNLNIRASRSERRTDPNR
ncbi:MAG: hypothetical protein KKG60_03130, partial [Nanoarchaeota archaeon]|nr:hypothetical protein [Nanoarchaeota archaeon]